MDKPGKTQCVSPTLPTDRRLPNKLHSTPQQHGMILISGNGEISSRLHAFSLFLPESCPNNRDHRSLLGKVLDEIGGIDVVVDDGSHIWTHQIATFEFLYPRLSATGTYICEDVHTSYWPEFSGDHAGPSFIEYCKKLLDDLHATYRLDDDAPDETFARITNSISFYDSMVVLERRNKPAPRHVTVGHRAVIV